MKRRNLFLQEHIAETRSRIQYDESEIPPSVVRSRRLHALTQRRWGGKPENKFKSLIKSAKYKALGSDIDFQSYDKIIQKGCQYCGTSLIGRHGHSLDRVDNSKGYFKDNVVGCCGDCNKIKNNFEITSLIEHLEKMANGLKKLQVPK